MKFKKTLAALVAGSALVSAFAGAALAEKTAVDFCIDNGIAATQRFGENSVMGGTAVKLDAIRASCEKQFPKTQANFWTPDVKITPMVHK